jgi:hypothetical protein
MLRLLSFLLLLLPQLLLSQLPCIQSNQEVITYSINGERSSNTWSIMPALKPDVLDFASEQKNNRVVFYTDVDSMVCNVKIGSAFQFYILFKGDSALTEVRALKAPPKAATFNKSFISKNKGKSGFDIPEVQELVHIVMALTPTGIADKNMVEHDTKYYEEVMARFKPWQDHPVVAAMDKVLNQQYAVLKMDACSFVFSKGKIQKKPEYDRMSWGWENTLTPYLAQLEDFAQQSEFQSFFNAHKAYYAELLKEAERFMPVQPQWEWLEREFSSRYDNYLITFSPLVNGSHSTSNFADNNFKQCIMFICSAEGRPADRSEAIWEAGMTRVVFTEIDHNYVNPVSDKYVEQISQVFNKTGFWADGVRTASYNSPYAVFNEYMTWAVFSLYAREKYSPEVAAQYITRMEKQMADNRGFLKFAAFNQMLIKTYDGRTEGQKVEDLYPQVLEWAAHFKG